MSVLNDKQLRKLCLIPTHQLVGAMDRRYLYSRVGDKFYSMETGETIYKFEPPESTWRLELKELTNEQQCGYAPNGNYVPDGARPALGQERGQLLTWGRMITPFVPHQVKERSVRLTADEGYLEKIISYGLSSFGYDLRLGHKFKVFSNVNSTMVDPKNFDNKAFVEVEVEKEGDEIIIPPNSFILAHSLEYFRMPPNVVGVVTGKSTIARSGINCLCTPLEPGWEGFLTLEFSNNTPLPAKLYVGEGCCQVMFYEGTQPETTYADRGGKYQGQEADAVCSKV